MLPDDPVLRGRLFRAARVLLGWSQAGLACAAGVGTAVVYRVEAGCPGSGAKAVAALAAAVEAAGVHFIGDGDIWGHGLRYVARPRPAGPPGGGVRAGSLTAMGHGRGRGTGLFPFRSPASFMAWRPRADRRPSPPIPPTAAGGERPAPSRGDRRGGGPARLPAPRHRRRGGANRRPHLGAGSRALVADLLGLRSWLTAGQGGAAIDRVVRDAASSSAAGAPSFCTIRPANCRSVASRRGPAAGRDGMGGKSSAGSVSGSITISASVVVIAPTPREKKQSRPHAARAPRQRYSSRDFRIDRVRL
jgi:hypothetical protein